MEVGWDQGQQSAHAAAALAGAFLGAALGADCFLAINHLAGMIPACLLCGAAMAFWAVRAGALFAGRDSRAGMVLSLLPIILWGSLANHLSFALAAAPGDPSGVWDALLSPEGLTVRYWFCLVGLLGMALCVWGLLYIQSTKGWELERRAARPCRNPPQPPPVGMEFFLPSQAWIQPWLIQRRITQGLWLTALFLCVWLPGLLGHEQAWFRALCGMGFSLMGILSLPGPGSHILAARSVLYVRWEGQLWRVAAGGIQYADLQVPLSRLLPMWDRLSGERKKSVLYMVAVAVFKGKNPAIYPIRRPRLERQNKWEWVVSGYFIPKVYPRFNPVPSDTEPAKEAVPVRWLNPAVTVLITAVCLVAGFCLGLLEERRAALLPSEPPPAEASVPGAREGGDETYWEDLDAACKLAVWEDGRKAGPVRGQQVGGLVPAPGDHRPAWAGGRGVLRRAEGAGGDHRPDHAGAGAVGRIGGTY